MKREDSIQLINGDCLEVMDKIGDNSVDLVICDLPYGVTQAKHDVKIPLNNYIIQTKKLRSGKIKEEILYEEDYLIKRYKEGIDYKQAIKEFKENSKEGLWQKYNRIVKENGAIILFGQDKFTGELMESNKKNHRYNLIWEKLGQPTGFLNANRMPLRSHEDILIFYKKLPNYFPQKTKGKPNNSRGTALKPLTNQNYGELLFVDNKDTLGDMKHPKSIISFNKPHPPIFATQKSVELCEWLIKSYSKEEDIVLDNTMGSGTTGIACLNTNRKFIGIEKDEENYNLAKERIEKEYD